MSKNILARKFIKILSFFIINFVLSSTIVYGILLSNDTNKIDNFIKICNLQKATKEEAEKNIQEKKFSFDAENDTNLPVNSFDVDSDGRIVISCTDGIHYGEIRVYDSTMKLIQKVSYQFNNCADFVLIDGEKVCFTDYKFLGVYVLDLDNRNIDVYNWTDYEEFFDKYTELKSASDEKQIDNVTYFLSNDKNKQTKSLTSDGKYSSRA